jgi:hypothetical protein
MMKKSRINRNRIHKPQLQKPYIASTLPREFRRVRCFWLRIACLAAAGLLLMPVPAAAGFPSVINVTDLHGSDGFVLQGIETEDLSGGSVSGAGDVNGDGTDDAIIGAPGAGQSYTVFGDSNGFPGVVSLSELDGYNGFAVNGRGGFFGGAVSNAGDVNGDGVDDVIIGDPETEECYVIFGDTSGFPAALNVSDLDGSNGFTLQSIETFVAFGEGVSSAGDVNGDGIDDVIIGAPMADPNGVADAGQSYVVFGNAGGFPAALNVASLDGSNGFSINGTGIGLSGLTAKQANTCMYRLPVMLIAMVSAMSFLRILRPTLVA